jgi:integrase
VNHLEQKMCGSLLATALRPAVKRGLMVRNPAAEVIKPRPADEELDVLTDDEMRTFLKSVDGNRLYALFVLAIGSGMRQGPSRGRAGGASRYRRL